MKNQQIQGVSSKQHAEKLRKLQAAANNVRARMGLPTKDKLKVSKKARCMAEALRDMEQELGVSAVFEAISH